MSILNMNSLFFFTPLAPIEIDCIAALVCLPNKALSLIKQHLPHYFLYQSYKYYNLQPTSPNEKREKWLEWPGQLAGNAERACGIFFLFSLSYFNFDLFSYISKPLS